MKDYEYNSIFLPYVLQKLEDNIGGWVILNRKYKFPGTTSWSHYELAPKHFRLPKVSDELRRYLSTGFKEPLYEDKVYFFNDGCSPLSKNASTKVKEQYALKLAMVSKLETVDNKEIHYSLLPAIERVNKWDILYIQCKILGRFDERE
jgi:hypothetical protein